MPRYLIERQFHVAEEQMPETNRRSKKIILEEFPEIVWDHSHVVLDESGTVRTYCVYEAPNEELLRRHAARLGAHEVVSIHLIACDVTPDDFPPV
jgi:Nickel responsive protein SCO4226-like